MGGFCTPLHSVEVRGQLEQTVCLATIWVLEMELRSLGLVADTSTCLAISLALGFCLLRQSHYNQSLWPPIL